MSISKTSWIIALILGILGLLVHQGVLRLPWLPVRPFWLVTSGWLLLLLAPLLRKL